MPQDSGPVSGHAFASSSVLLLRHGKEDAGGRGCGGVHLEGPRVLFLRKSADSHGSRKQENSIFNPSAHL